MMRRYGDLMASTGEFVDDNGHKAKRWLKCGVVMRDDRSGAFSIKLEAVPVRPDWSGWFAVRNVSDDAGPGIPDHLKPMTELYSDPDAEDQTREDASSFAQPTRRSGLT